MKHVLTAESLLTPYECISNSVVVIEGGRVVAAGSRDSIDVPADARVHDFGAESVITPGFIDVHIHGAAGHEIMEASPERFRDIALFLANHGVTSYVPTTITAPIDEILSALDRIATLVERDAQREPAEDGGARALGIHLEGPFISHARRGVHPPMHILPPSPELFDRLWEAARGHIIMMTIAPELPEALEVIARAVRRGVCVSLGHSNAETEPTLEAIEAGARHATHMFNAMRRLEHRNPGIAGVILTDPRISADIIADGLHVHPIVVDLFLRAKGRDLAVLISDGTSATGMPDGKYKLGSFEVEVKGIRVESHGKLAGSVLTLDAAVRHVMEFAGWPLHDAVRLVTANPARILGREKHTGQVAAGFDADLAILTHAGDVIDTVVAGAL